MGSAAAQRIVLYGGSFDPPHVAHQLAALYVLETRQIDELWLVPCFRHPFDKPLAGFEHRFRMCELAAAALGPRVRVSDIERRMGGESRTLRTVRQLKAELPSAELSLLIGSDLVEESKGWYGAEELRREVQLVVVARAGTRDTAAAGGGTVEIPAVSSTAVRRALAEGRPVDALVARSVLDYIHTNRLYAVREPA